MARQRRNASPEELTVYAIFNVNKDSVFIGSCKQGNLRRNFSSHYNLRCPHTEALFHEAKLAGELPEVYLLQNVVCLKKLIYNYYTVWARYFVEHGIKIIPNRRNDEFCMNLFEHQEKLYDEIKDIPFNDVCGKEKVLFRDYGDKSPQRELQNKYGERLSTISVRVTYEQYQAVKREAGKNGRTIAEFCRQRILTGDTINIDYSFAMEFFNEMMEDRELLRQILFAIYSRGSYLPKDMENIQRLVDDILKNAKEIDRSFRRQIREIKDRL